jgi:predicted Abi (CAAX) family protease
LKRLWLIAEAQRRLWMALRLPDRGGWRRALPIAVGGVAIIAAVAIATGLARFDPMPFGWTWLLHAAFLVVVPSLGEEILFRGLIVPPRDRSMPTLAGIGAVAVFVLWHPLQAVTIGPPWCATFLDPAFLAIVAILGTTLVWMYRRSGSIWPGVIVHWLVVAGWKLIFGGPIG